MLNLHFSHHSKKFVKIRCHKYAGTNMHKCLENNKKQGINTHLKNRSPKLSTPILSVNRKQCKKKAGLRIPPCISIVQKYIPICKQQSKFNLKINVYCINISLFVKIQLKKFPHNWYNISTKKHTHQKCPNIWISLVNCFFCIRILKSIKLQVKITFYIHNHRDFGCEIRITYEGNFT